MQPSDVTNFWFSDEAKPSWFKKSDEFDNRVRDTLRPYYDAARNGRLTSWEETPEGALALVLLLDQAPRNIFRGQAQAFASDADALAISRRAIECGFDQSLDMNGKLFLYLPFEHAEQLDAQDESVRLISALGDAEYTKYAERHRDVIARFGRFPHRNAVLGRPSTPEEIEFLQQPGSSF